MFKKSSVFVLLKDDTVKKLELAKDVQLSICSTFSIGVINLLEKDEIEFDGSYKPHDDECLFIRCFDLLEDIRNAIRDPIGIESFNPFKDDEIVDIKAIFVGSYKKTDNEEIFDVAFQKFKKEQHIQPTHYNLFYSEGTFRQEKNKGLSITDAIDCIFINDNLKFSSFYYARQIFALNEYYRIATDNEVERFVKNERLSIGDVDIFKQISDNTWIRRKIAMINDSNVLGNNSAEKIQNSAKQIGLKIEVRNKKIVLPNNKEDLKNVLGFLDEEAYQGPFSQNTYLANSKRKIAP